MNLFIQRMVRFSRRLNSMCRKKRKEKKKANYEKNENKEREINNKILASKPLIC